VYREILWNLVRKEIKVRYSASVLGAIWSLLNPLVFMAVFAFVSIVLGSGIPDIAVFLLSGLLAWNVYSVSLSVGAQSVISNANLVKKVYFPREILPLSSVGVALFDFVLQSIVLFAFLLVTGYGLHLYAIWMYPLAFLCLLAFTVAMTLSVSALNVRYRDTQHLLGIALLVWFWMTPIVYAPFLVQNKLSHHSVLGVNLWHVYLLNPMVTIVSGFQRALYESVQPPGATQPVLIVVSLGWLAVALLVVLALSSIFAFLAWRMFFKMSGDFAEEL
jgi:ABC-2 type transport system permease protein